MRSRGSGLIMSGNRLKRKLGELGVDVSSRKANESFCLVTPTVSSPQIPSDLPNRLEHPCLPLKSPRTQANLFPSGSKKRVDSQFDIHTTKTLTLAHIRCAMRRDDADSTVPSPVAFLLGISTPSGPRKVKSTACMSFNSS